MPVTRQQVYDALTAEDNYAKAWSKGNQSKVDGVPDHMVRHETGIPFSEAEWVIFAEKYLAEMKLAYANFVPDNRALTSRLLKAASMLIAAIQTNAVDEQELKDIAGVSSTKYPVLTGGLAQFKALTEANPGLEKQEKF